MWLRVLESLTFAYSISYFFFVSRPSVRIQMINCIVFELINVLFILCGGGAFYMRMDSKCSDTAFGKAVMIMAGILIL